MHLRPLRLVLHVGAVVVLAGSGVLLVGAPSHADSAPRPDSYGGDSAASAMHFVADRSPQPTAVTDLFHAEAPYATTSLDSSGSATGSAASMYPGGGLLGVPGLLCQVGPCLPLPPYALMASASYPTKPDATASASAGTYGQPPLSVAPQLTVAHADPNRVEAQTTTGKAELGGVVGSDNASTHSKQVFEGSTLVVTAESVLKGVDFAGGVVHIDSIRSVATARVDGGKVTASSATTTISGARAGGQPVTIDSNGIHAGGKGDGGAAQAAVNTALQQLDASGIKMRLLTPSKAASPGQASAAAGGLLVTFAQTVNLPLPKPPPLPPNLPGAPGVNGVYTGSVTLAGAGVTAFATLADAVVFPAVGVPTSGGVPPLPRTFSRPGTGTSPSFPSIGLPTTTGTVPAFVSSAPRLRHAAVLGVDLTSDRLGVLVMILLGYPMIVLLSAVWRAPSRLPRGL